MSVRGIEIKERLTPAFDGAHFGRAGAYEKIAGRFLCEADPADPANAVIALIDKAPRNASGMVEYSVDFCSFAPVDLALGSGWIFYEFLNRGSQRGVMRIMNAPFSVMPETVEQLGDAFLLEQGHVLLWTAWQGNVEPAGGPMLADLPVAREADGFPITALAREEVVLDAPDSIRGASIRELDERRFVLNLSYPAAGDARAEASLSVRSRADAERTLPEGVRWNWIDDRSIEIETDPSAGIDRGALYEFIYRAQDPVVMGLGYAGIRDTIAFLHHESTDAEGNPNPLAPDAVPAIRRVMGFGLSQSGRTLRDFLWQGFNADLAGRPVFDGVIPIIGGARKAWVNAPFSQPGRYSRQHEDHDFPGDQFPFAYAPQTDPLTGRTDDVLARARAAGVAPKLMHLDTDSEYWSARASLVTMDCEGRDVDLPEDVRVYLASSVAHGDYPSPSGEVLPLATNPLTYGPILRALTLAMAEWVDDGRSPPPSRYPRRSDGTLVTLEEFQAAFPKVAAMVPPNVLNALVPTDHDAMPPAVGAGQYPVFVPAPDANGNTAPGVRHPLVEAATGTHSGWAVRNYGFAPDMLYSVYGSYLPLADTAEARDVAADPRPSFAERYGDAAGWRDAVRHACEALVAERLMLPADAARLADAEPDRPAFNLI